MADVEMKPAGEEEKKEEEKKVEEPTDNFYGKSKWYISDHIFQFMLTESHFLIFGRAEEVFGYFGEGWQGERLQDSCAINQIIQKTSQDVQLIRHRPCHQVLPPRSLPATSAAMSANGPRGQ